jgi:UDP-N-acetylglucosamine--N-acetylmuramyl-(pentapeptide) pyrophosphoryl-undecaprenol N-acetylglucosamine transferase
VTSGTGGEAFLAREVPALLAAVGGGVRLEVVHQAGLAPPVQIDRAYRDAGIEAVIRPFVDDMAGAYRRAHVAITRGGAGTLAELGVTGLPAVVVPLASAADDHQTANARQFEAAGAGMCVREREWQREAVARWLRELLTDPIKWRRASEAASRSARVDAAARLVTDCAALIKMAEPS